jgi:Tfp pilus assembly protein PilF
MCAVADDRIDAAPGRLGARAHRLAPAFVLCLTVAAFVPTLENGFVDWDDKQNFLQNPFYRGLGAPQLRWMFTTFHMGHYQPLAWLTLGADHALWGMNPAGYHLTSLAWHVANAGLFYLLAVVLLARAAPAASRERLALAAAFSTGLFALHPLRVESVAWATERRDVVSGFFFLLSVLAYVRAVSPGSAGSGDGAEHRAARRRAAWFATSVCAFALALLGKAIVATLPALLLVIDVCPLRRLGAGGAARRAPRASAASILLEKLPFAAFSAASVLIGLRAQRASEVVPGLSDVGVASRAAIAARGLAFYAAKTLLPTGLSPAHVIPPDFRPTAPAFVASAAVVVALTAALVSLRRRWPAALAAWIAYAVALTPVLGLVQVWRQIVAERYSYLACLGFALLGGGALLSLLRRASTARAPATASRAPAATPSVATRPPADAPPALAGRAAAIVAAAALLLLALAALTARQVHVWHDSETLWRSALASQPDNYLAHQSLGVELVRQGRLREAEESYRRSLALKDDEADVLADLGGLALSAERYAEAEAYLTRSVALAPNVVALTNLGILQLERGDRAGAQRAYRAALSLSRDNPEALASLGALALSDGRVGEAEAYIDSALALWPENAKALSNRGVLRLRRGDRDGALRDLATAARLQPGLADAWKNLGVALESSGRFAEAAAAFERFLDLNPGNRDARRSLASTLLRAGDAARGIAVARENVASDSTDWASANLLAWALATAADPALRDPPAALRAAEWALAAAGGGAVPSDPLDPNLLDTYAAALATAGRFDEACEAARRAAAAAARRGDSTLAREASERLALYERREPFRAR